MTADPVTEVNAGTRDAVLRAIKATVAQGIEPSAFGVVVEAALNAAGTFDADRIAELEAEDTDDAVLDER